MKQVLIVDDLFEVRLVMRTLLEEGEIEILEAGDGREALEVLEGGAVDLVVADNQMPNMTGLELMKAAQERFPSLPFIVVSSTAEEVDFKPFGPRAIMSKPFQLADLKHKVDEVLGETS